MRSSASCAPSPDRRLRLEDSGGLGHEAGRQHSANVDDLLVGKPLVQSMVSSFRVTNQKVRDDPGWSPNFPTAADAMPSTLTELDGRAAAMSPAG